MLFSNLLWMQVKQLTLFRLFHISNPILKVIT